MLITVLPNPSWQLSLAQLSPSLFVLFLVGMGVGVLDEIKAISAPAKLEFGLGLILAKSF